jgi:hypothetical protein
MNSSRHILHQRLQTIETSESIHRAALKTFGAEIAFSGDEGKGKTVSNNLPKKISRIAGATLLATLCALAQDHKWAGRTLDPLEWTIHERLAVLPSHGVLPSSRQDNALPKYLGSLRPGAELVEGH